MTRLEERLHRQMAELTATAQKFLSATDFCVYLRAVAKATEQAAREAGIWDERHAREVTALAEAASAKEAGK